MTPETLTKEITNAIIEKKGTNIMVLNVTGLTSITDYFIIATANSDSQAKAISENILDKTRELGERPFNKEGYTNFNWVLLDYVDVVVHIFLEDSRKFYNLEGLWGDAEITHIKDEPE